MLTRMVGLWLAGLGLVTVGLAQEAAPTPTKEQLDAARKKVRAAQTAVNKMAKGLYKEDQALAALKAKSDDARKAMNEAVHKVLATMPEAKELMAKNATLAAEIAELRKQGRALRGKKDKEQRAALSAKQKDLRAQRAELGKQLRKPRGKASRDPSVAPLRKVAHEARKAHQKALREKLSATPEGQKALADLDQVKKEQRALQPKRKRAPRKERAKKGKRGKKRNRAAQGQ